MLTPVILVLGLMAATAVIAYWSDNLGKKLGKQRVSLLGLRPKDTATLLTVASSLLIMLTTFGAMLVVHRPLRHALLRYDETRASLALVQLQVATAQKAGKRASEEEKKAQYRAATAGRQAANAEARAKTAESRVKAAAQRVKAAEQSVQKASERESEARRDAEAAGREAESARRIADAARKTAGAAQANASEARARAGTAAKRETEARKRADNAAAAARKAAADLDEARDNLREERNDLRNARKELAEARPAVASARAELASARAELAPLQNQLEVKRNEVANAKVVLDAKGIELLKQEAQLLKQEAQLLKQEENLRLQEARIKGQTERLAELQTKVAGSEEQLRIATQGLEAARQQLTVAATVLTGAQMVGANETLAERVVKPRQSQSQVQAELESLIESARTQARRLGEAEGRLNVGIDIFPQAVRLEGREVEVDARTQLAILAQELVASESATAVRVISARAHAIGEPNIKVRLLALGVRPAFRRGEVLASGRIDGRDGDAKIFRQLLALANAGQRAAEEKEVRPPLSREVLFYEEGTNERIFEALRLIRALNTAASVRVVASEDLNTAAPLRVRFEVAASALQPPEKAPAPRAST
jgi:uncharacterized protein (DUF3084 family)